MFGLDGINAPDFRLKIAKISCGENHTGMLSIEGLLYMCGSNEGYKIGIPNLCDKKELR